MIAGAVTTVSAHRRDEYLQVARLDIASDRIEVQLDLTPGIALADRVVREIDRDHDGVVSGAEARAYASVVEQHLALAVDGRRLPLQLRDSQPASVRAMKEGVGTLQVRWTAGLPPLSPGVHRVRFSNAHEAEISVYLANVLVPESDRLAVTGQDRDADQKTFAVTYELKTGRSAGWGGAVATVLGGLLAAGAGLRRSARSWHS